MKKKIELLAEQAREIFGDETEFLLVTNSDHVCGAICHGQVESIAEAVFACIHDSTKPASAALYRILKLNVMNILDNPSPFGADLAEAIVNTIPGIDE